MPPADSKDTPRSQLETFAALIRDRRISHGAFRLWHALRDYTNPASQCFPGQRRLAADIGCHPTSLKPWTDELTTAGWLKVEGGNGCRFDYTVMDGNGSPLRKGASLNKATAPESSIGGDTTFRNTTAPESSIEPHRKVASKVSSPINQAHLREGGTSPHLEKLAGWQLRKDLRESNDPAERAAIQAEMTRRRKSSAKPIRPPHQPPAPPTAGLKRFTPSPELAAQLREGFKAAVKATRP